MSAYIYFNLDPTRAAGFAFLQYMKLSEAQAAISSLNTKQIGGRKIAVDYAVPKDTYMTATAGG